MVLIVGAISPIESKPSSFIIFVKIVELTMHKNIVKRIASVMPNGFTPLASAQAQNATRSAHPIAIRR